MTAPAAPVEAHDTHVEFVGGRYPWRPVCACGRPMWGYVAEHAARTMADHHATTGE